MTDTDLRFRAEDLSRLAIACPSCRTEQVFHALPLTELKQIVCQNCDRPLRGVKELIVSYRAFFAEVQRAPHVAFIVRQSSTDGLRLDRLDDPAQP